MAAYRTHQRLVLPLDDVPPGLERLRVPVSLLVPVGPGRVDPSDSNVPPVPLVPDPVVPEPPLVPLVPVELPVPDVLPDSVVLPVPDEPLVPPVPVDVPVSDALPDPVVPPVPDEPLVPLMPRRVGSSVVPVVEPGVSEVPPVAPVPPEVPLVPAPLP